MEDMERYGDYNEYDESPSGKSPVLTFIKIAVFILCAAVIGLLAFRMVLFDYYPDSMKTLYFNDELLDYYNQTGGNIGAKTQNLRAPYDDPDRGSFFAENLFVISGVEQLQLSLRYNVSAMEDIEAEYKTEGLDPDDESLLSFRLVDNHGGVYSDVVYVERDAYLMYRYIKLVFDGVNVEPDENGEYPEWIRIEIFVKGHEDKPYAMIPVYENHELYSEFSDYIPSDKEIPQ